jgi:hypothetical protein
MACEGYSRTALMGNWYEERLAVPQKSRDQPDHRLLREEEGAIAYMTQNNKLHPLPRVQRVPKWNTAQVINDDGFKEYRSEFKTKMDPLILTNFNQYKDCRQLTKTVEAAKRYPENHTQIQTAGATKMQMLTHNNFTKEVIDKTREVQMHVTDFGSTFKTHPNDHNRFFAMTAYQSAFDKPYKQGASEYAQTQGTILAREAGTHVRPMDQTGIKMVSVLTGELHKTSNDPQNNTRMQRSWLPYKENALEQAEGNITKNTMRNSSMGMKTGNQLANYKTNMAQTLPYDIATSLPMDRGEYDIKSKWLAPGSFRHIRSDVTDVRNKPLTKK